MTCSRAERSIGVCSRALDFFSRRLSPSVTPCGLRKATLSQELLPVLARKRPWSDFCLSQAFRSQRPLHATRITSIFDASKESHPLYLFSVLAAIALEVWLGQFKVPNYEFKPTGAIAAIGNLFLVQTFLVKTVAFNGVLWSLAVEASFYVVSPVLRRLPLSAFAAFVAVSAIFYLMPFHTNWGLIYTYLLKANAVKYFWPFAIGFTMYFNRSAPFFVGSVVLGAALVWCSEDNYEPLAAVTFAFSMLVIFAACNDRYFTSRILDYVGDISYPLYLVQIPIYVTFYAVFGITNNFALYAGAVAAAAVAYEFVDVRLKEAIFKSPALSTHASP